VVYFLLYLFIEIIVSVNISSEIGALWTFVEIVVSALVGITLIANFKFTLMDNLQALYQREIEQKDFIKLNLAVIVGAILLIIPGFFTDILGILLQFEFFALIIAKLFSPKREHFNNTNYNSNQFNRTRRDDEIIDVEVIDDRNSK
jgi:UPF0716 family protein affecting phage T7 exclusion